MRMIINIHWMMNYLNKLTVAALLLTAFSAPLQAQAEGYSYETLVASKPAAVKAYGKPDTVMPELINAWGIAIRPVGAGGHFWVTSRDKSFQYTGDVRASDDAKFQILKADPIIPTITIPNGGAGNFTTGVTFTRSKDFEVEQTTPQNVTVKAPAKFLFAADGGIISAWTEHKKDDGTFDWPNYAKAMIDESKLGTQFFGLTLNNTGDQLYAANFGKNARVETFNSNFKPANIAFDQPFDKNQNSKVDSGEYAPYNVRDIKGHVFVTYAMTQACNKEGLEKKDCKKGEIYAGEEVKAKGKGRIAEFSEDGKLIAIWNDKGMLNAPWGMEVAPDSFGALAGKMLVGSFGDGTITVFDPETKGATGKLMVGGKPFKLEGLWGLQFGNGATLGDANALYLAAGPEDEKQGAFGVIRPIQTTESKPE